MRKNIIALALLLSFGAGFFAPAVHVFAYAAPSGGSGIKPTNAPKDSFSNISPLQMIEKFKDWFHAQTGYTFEDLWNYAKDFSVASFKRGVAFVKWLLSFIN